MSKEAQIMNLQSFIKSINNPLEEKTFEYHYFDDKTVTCCMDHFMAGIRSEMANTTRLLNIEQNKVIDKNRLIEEKKKEIEDIKCSKANTPPTEITPEVMRSSNHKDSKVRSKKKARMKRV
jgi:ribosomal protein L14E/L6E/L27E